MARYKSKAIMASFVVRRCVIAFILNTREGGDVVPQAGEANAC